MLSSHRIKNIDVYHKLDGLSPVFLPLKRFCALGSLKSSDFLLVPGALWAPQKEKELKIAYHRADGGAGFDAAHGGAGQGIDP
jgi:hypothetical protein